MTGDSKEHGNAQKNKEHGKAQENIKNALEALEPENLFTKADEFKQKSNNLSSTTPPIISGRLADISSITSAQKYRIYSDLARDYATLVESGNVPPSLTDPNLSGQDKQDIVTHVLNRVSSAESMSNTQAVLRAAFNGHTKLEAAYYQDAINQSERSFTVALIAAVIAVLIFLVGIVVLVLNVSASSNTATITTIAGAIVALISGVNFYLYGMASTQFTAFHARLDRLQRFSLAEYMCELLETEMARDNALATVIANLASSALADSPMYITPMAPASDTQTGQQPASGT